MKHNYFFAACSALVAGMLAFPFNAAAQDSEEWGELSQHITYSIPSSLEANLTNTRTPFGNTAMGIVSFGLNTSDITGVAGSPNIVYSYSPTQDGAKSVLAEINAANPDEVTYMGVQLTEDEGDDTGLLEFPASHFLFMLFASDGDGHPDMELIGSKFKNDGYYTLSIPDGAFRVEGKLMRGVELTFHFTATVVEGNLSYELTPAANSNVADPAATFGIDGTGIDLYFPEAKEVDCLSKPATLTLPNGKVLTKVAPAYSHGGKGLLWKFGTRTTEWEEGEYVFEIADGKIGVDMGSSDNWEDWGEKGNFPALKVIYYVGEETGVTLIGADKAESYTVVTLDGKVVLNGAPIEALTDLPAGIYVINGKKTIVRK